MDLEIYKAIAVLSVLALFGVMFNRWVERLEQTGKSHGFVSFLVVIGVAATGILYTVWEGSLQSGLRLVACFVASGVPMIVGSVNRYINERDEALGEVRREARDKLDEQ